MLRNNTPSNGLRGLNNSRQTQSQPNYNNNRLDIQKRVSRLRNEQGVRNELPKDLQQKYRKLYTELKNNGGNYNLIKKLENSSLYGGVDLEDTRRKAFPLPVSNQIYPDFASQVLRHSVNYDRVTIDKFMRYYDNIARTDMSVEMYMAVTTSKGYVDKHNDPYDIGSKLAYVRELVRMYEKYGGHPDNPGGLWQAVRYEVF